MLNTRLRDPEGVGSKPEVAFGHLEIRCIPCIQIKLLGGFAEARILNLGIMRWPLSLLSHQDWLNVDKSINGSELTEIVMLK